MRSLVLILAAAAAIGGGAAAWLLLRGSDSPSAADGDVLELVVTVRGKLVADLGSSHEWYRPATGAYHVERRLPRARVTTVYDGSSITRRTAAGITRIAGERAMVTMLAAWANILEEPGVTIVKQFRSGRRSQSLRISPRDGDRVLDVDWHLVDEGTNVHVPIRVEIRESLDAEAARARGIFAPLRGRVVGQLLGSAPGTRPHFGRHAYWFGDRLGAAKAKSVVERTGIDPLDAEDRTASPPSYELEYLLPAASLPASARDSGGRYPELGTQQGRDVWVRCQQYQRGFLPAVAPGTRGRPLRLASGERATLFMTAYSQYGREGVDADIVVGDTVCIVSGLIAPAEFRRLARTLRRV